MKLNECWTEIEAAPSTMAMHDVFNLIANHPDWPFLPVVDVEQRPLGVIREYDLKRYAYARFGRELIRRRPLADFLKPTLVLPVDTTLDALLAVAAKNPNPDGLILTENGKYRGVLLTDAVLSLFEKQRLTTEVRLVQAQKMEALGTLAGGIAHDLNNILTPIFGYAEMMKIMVAEGEPMEADLPDQILVNTMRARDVVKQILTFSRHQTAERSPMSLGEAIKEVLRLLRASLPPSIEIEMHLGVPEDLIMANPSEIHRVILNLCTNAYHAMRERGHLQIDLERHQGPLLGWSLYTIPQTGEYFRLSLTDTGTGIDPNILPRIFDPFFTTKKQGEGTGLGLSVVHGIVTKCQGLISVETALGQGTTFHIYLPCLHQKRPGATTVPASVYPSAASHVRSTALHKIKVLFVDDEFAITRMAGRILPRYGIELETENNSVVALELLHKRAAEFDLLITDQLMPGITGMELVSRVQKIRPDLPIIICTGYSETVSAEEARQHGIGGFLLKPFDFNQLAALIQKLVPTPLLHPSIVAATTGASGTSSES